MVPLFQNLDRPKACCTVNTAPLFWKYTLEPVLLGRVPVGHGTSDVIQADIKTIGWVLDNFKHIKHIISYIVDLTVRLKVVWFSLYARSKTQSYEEQTNSW